MTTVQDLQVEEVVQTWRDMAGHVKSAAGHMMSLAASQEATERAARASVASVRFAAWSFVLILTVAALIIGLMVDSANRAAANHREGQRIQNALIEKRLEETRDLVLECKRIGHRN
jgi:hypothetical protein